MRIRPYLVIDSAGGRRVMRKSFVRAGLVSFALTVAAIGAAVQPAGASNAGGFGGKPDPLPAHSDRAVCNGPGAPDLARCDARVVTTPDGTAPLATSTWQSGYAATDITSAYNLPNPTGTTWSGNGSTIAIVDAYANPNAESDLGVYRSRFGLPPCTTANTCFKPVS